MSSNGHGWQNRIVEYGVKRADQFQAHPRNWRTHPKHQRMALAASLGGVGWVDAVTENAQTGHLIDGHERIWQALEQGDDTPVPFIAVNLTEDEELLVLATFDPITQMATRDEALLEGLLADLRQTDMIQADERLNALLHQVAADAGVAYGDYAAPGDPGAQLDRAEALREQWGTARGQVWEIPSATVPGKCHRVMCGDSTSGADVERLMEKEKSSLVVTDPPYGVEYADKNEFLNAISPGNRIQTPISGDHEDKAGTQELWRAAFEQMNAVMSPGAVVYCFMPQGGDQMMMMMMMMMGAGIEPRHELIWLKNNHVLGRVDYAYKHEPILYAWKEGGHKFYGGFQTSVIEVDKPQKSDLHPTTKPVELIEKLIMNSSLQREIVFDPFFGSGTTIVAAEQTGRIAYGMEIEPKYVGVCLQRLADMGLSPALVE